MLKRSWILLPFSILLNFVYIYSIAQSPEVLTRPGYYCRKNHQQIIPASSFSAALNSRSDTLDILHYTINLDITNLTGKKIRGNCQVFFKPKMNGVDYIALDLLQLPVDSVTMGNSKLTFSYNDTLLIAWFAAPLNTGDSAWVTVYYGGTPQMDWSWGGFYFQGNYAYNMGVGFDANPHNYGRVWFPCFDNFIERSTYTFNITTSGGKKAVCGGVLTNEDTLGGDTILRTWKLNQTIPTYLASVAVGPYVFVKQTYSGIQNNFPVVLASAATDTTKMKNSFINLNNALSAFETGFGPFLWDRAGYVLVPFTDGAMEHASNIAFPISFANGSLFRESTMAHELAHNWWGNLATCETEGDMWINEGGASFSEFIFTEKVYGKAAYSADVKSNHAYILWRIHNTEGGYRALYNMPHEYTYGDHVYLKGADVLHTLRGYLGDSLFFVGLNSFFNAYRFTDVNSYKMRDHLTAATGYDLTDFFNGWVFNGGWPHFSVDSVNSSFVGPGNYSVAVYLKQKITGAPDIFKNVPLDITFWDSSWSRYTEQRIITGFTGIEMFNLNAPPLLTVIDYDERISDAITSETRIINSAGTYELGNSSTNGLRFTLAVNSISDSLLIRVEHNWTSPDPIAVPTIFHLNPYRYWKVMGIFPSAWSANAKIYYNGTPSSYLDVQLFSDSIATEDSLVLLFRKNAGENWTEFPYYTKNMITNPTDKLGRIDMDSVMPGEYVFAMKGDTLFTGEENISFGPLKPGVRLDLFPNPAAKEVKLVIRKDGKHAENQVLKISDISGRDVSKEFSIFADGQYSDGTEGWILSPFTRTTAGIFFIQLFFNGNLSVTGKIVLIP